MNRNGQTLIAFVIIVPIFILLLAFVVDTGFILKEYTKLNSLTRTILKTNYQKRFDDDYTKKITNLYKKNNISIENLEVIVNENETKIINFYDINSIFGKIIGIKNYDIKIEIKAYEEEGKIIIEKE